LCSDVVSSSVHIVEVTSHSRFIGILSNKPWINVKYLQQQQTLKKGRNLGFFGKHVFF